MSEQKFHPLSRVALATLLLGTPVFAQNMDVTQHLSRNANQAFDDATGASVSDDGQFVVYSVNRNGISDVYLWSRATGQVTSVTPGATTGSHAQISGNGSFVVFQTESSGLDILTSDTNGVTDVYRWSRSTGQYECISHDGNIGPLGTRGVPSGPSYHPVVNQDGLWVAFESQANDVGQGMAGVPIVGSTVYHYYSGNPFGAYPFGDYQPSSPIYPNLPVYLGDISANGQHIAVHTSATNLNYGMPGSGSTDILRSTHPTVGGGLYLASRNNLGLAAANGQSFAPAINGDGSMIAFYTDASDCVAGDSNGYRDVILHDVSSNQNELISQSTWDDAANDHCDPWWFFQHVLDISNDGRFVSFDSIATSLTNNGVAEVSDVFLRDRQTGITRLVSVNDDAFGGTGRSSGGQMSKGDPRYVVFHSEAANLDSTDTDVDRDIYIRDMRLGGPSLTVNQLISGQPSTISISGATANNSVALGYAFSKFGPLATPYGILDLPGGYLWLPLPTDASGNASLTLTLPAGLTGVPLQMQGLNPQGTSFYPTEAYAEIIQ
jgi:Tol biopolymer transport system component